MNHTDDPDAPNDRHHLTPEQIGVPEYRLLLRSEIQRADGPAIPEISVWCEKEQCWKSTTTGFAGTIASITYRVPATVTPERLRALRGIPEGPQIIDVPSEVLPPKGFWWCPDCQRQIDPREVTFSEHHDPNKGGCGDALQWLEKEPEPELAALRRSLHEAQLGALAMETAHRVQAARIEALEAGLRDMCRALGAHGTSRGLVLHIEPIHEICDRLLSPEAGA